MKTKIDCFASPGIKILFALAGFWFKEALLVKNLSTLSLLSCSVRMSFSQMIPLSLIRPLSHWDTALVYVYGIVTFFSQIPWPCLLHPFILPSLCLPTLAFPWPSRTLSSPVNIHIVAEIPLNSILSFLQEIHIFLFKSEHLFLLLYPSIHSMPFLLPHYSLYHPLTFATFLLPILLTNSLYPSLKVLNTPPFYWYFRTLCQEMKTLNLCIILLNYLSI